MAIQDKFNKAGVIYKITSEIDLGGGTLNIPSGCTLDFQGGCIKNGSVNGNGCLIQGDASKCSATFNNVKYFNEGQQNALDAIVVNVDNRMDAFESGVNGSIATIQATANNASNKADSAVSTANAATSTANQAISTANQAATTATTAKNAVATLEGLANTTTAQETLAAQVVQIEENKQNIDELASELGLNIQWIQGSIEDGSNAGWPVGTINEMPIRICAKIEGLIVGTSIYYSIPDDYYLAIADWDGVSELITHKSGWLNGDGEFILENSNVFLVVAKGDRNQNIYPQEGEKVKIDFQKESIMSQLNSKADKEKTNKNISDIKKELEGIYLAIRGFNIQWIQGSIEDGSNAGWPVGTINEMPIRICAKIEGLIVGTSIYYSIPDDYYLAIADWDGVSELVTNKSGWLSGNGEFEVKNKNVFLVVAKGDRNQNIYPQEGEKVKISNVNIIEDDNGWNKKTFVSYGDSITERNTWQPYLVSEFGLKHTNLGVGGTRVAKTDAKGGVYENSYSEDARISKIPTDADLITIMGGANDFGSPYPSFIGDVEYDRTTGGYKTDNFVSALCETIRKIQTRCKEAVICVLPWIGGQYTNANYPYHEITIKDKPIENGVLYITINGVKHEISYTKGQSIESLVSAISSINQNLVETRGIGNIVGFYDKNDIDNWNFKVEGGDSFLTYETKPSLPLRYNHIGNTPLDFRNAAKKAADYMNVYYIDIWNCGFNAVNRDLYFSDTVHPNALGGERMARFLIGELKKIQPI